MVEPRDSNDRLSGCSPQTQHHCYQVIRTTRVHHHSSRSSRMVSVQEKVIRSRLQLGYSTPTSFINRCGRKETRGGVWWWKVSMARVQVAADTLHLNNHIGVGVSGDCVGVGVGIGDERVGARTVAV
ncbi:hypothetical protein M0802_006778 [Mischocyttarus mexicanus]|nr:hypothetical protein M0802_006778 [Mischocyttarus mexicanus]